MPPNSAIPNPELIFGFVGPMGVNLDRVTEAFVRELSVVGYESKIIRITELMKVFDVVPGDCPVDYVDAMEWKIRNANAVCEEHSDSAMLSYLSMSEILRQREEMQDKNGNKTGRAYIIRQFKRKSEIDAMRTVYGRKFILISIYADYEFRKAKIIDNIKSSTRETFTDVDLSCKADKLIDLDQKEKSIYGQGVRDIFHLGDVFVSSHSLTQIDSTVKHFVRVLFGDNSISPSKDEYGLYMAAATSLRSVDLSRQVGAAIFSPSGEIITQGCNEVPKPFGGTYWQDDEGEKFRDVELQYDTNSRRKMEIIYNFVSILIEEKLIVIKEEKVNDYITSLLELERIKQSQFMDIIEFGRMIHAEMSAMCDAARLGSSIKDSTLYCTTFPCHMCAKHIVASGVRRVVFLEPYPKSYAADLHSDSITFDKAKSEARVLFEPFIGISPRRYRDLFEKRRRKNNDGNYIEWYHNKPEPMIEDRSSSYLENEQAGIAKIL